MTSTTSTWSNGQSNRDRQAVAVLVTEDGQLHQFGGSAIPGVCAVAITGAHKNGKWSSRTFAVTHRPTTVFASWVLDWDTGQTWPQASWESGFAWLAAKAPGISMAGFDAGVRKNWPKTAARWDTATAAADEFAVALPLAHGDATAAKVAEIAAKAATARVEAEQVRTATAELERANSDLAYARSAQDRAQREAARISAEKAESARLAAPLAHNPFGALKI